MRSLSILARFLLCEIQSITSFFKMKNDQDLLRELENDAQSRGGAIVGHADLWALPF